MAIENKQEVIDWLKKDENKTFLGDNNFQTEKTIEVPASITGEDVTEFISGNQGYRDKLHNTIQTDFLKKKTGLEAITPEMLGEKLYLESGVKTNNEAYKKALIVANMQGVKNPELLVGLIDGSKVEFKDGKLEGFEDQFTSLKTKYPDQFEVANIPPANTPPAGGGTPPTQITYEKFEGMTATERSAVPQADIDRMMTEV